MQDLLDATISTGTEMFKGARALIFPDQCPACRSLVDSGSGLCGRCWRDTPFLLGLTCDQCSAPMLGHENEGPVRCDTCRSLERPWQQGRSVLSYTGNARRLMLGFKHGDRLDLGPVFARWMVARAKDLIEPDSILIPVPIHRGRLLKRRYNQSAVLSRLIANLLSVAHEPDALWRTKHTRPLDKGDFSDRIEHVKNTIGVNDRLTGHLAGRSVVLVDDVLTTGATLTTCSLQLQQCHVRNINVITLCRAHDSV